ncbi:MAG: acyl-CoA thioesterase [Dehalococcoidia bacterium]|nr:acyl-CoA thioesterase [Dehalococcoidia bacterium]
MAQVLLPDQSNVAGYVHGGELMKVMDNAAWVVACRHARKNGVTANVEEMNFHSRVRIGDLVLMHARITYAGRTSMEVRIDVETEDLFTGRKVQALTAYFTVVAIDAYGNPASVPPLIVSTDEEERFYAEGKARYEARKKARQAKEMKGA